MFARASTLVSVALPTLVLAGIPAYDGMTVIFSDDFEGDAGDPIDTSVWDIATGVF